MFHGERKQSSQVSKEGCGSKETWVQCGSGSTWERERKGVEGTAMAGGKGAENKNAK